MNQNRIRVLVVDDTALYRKIVTAVLNTIPGVDVVGTAANGRIALSKIDDLQPDVITLDLEMPEVDGLEVLRRLKATANPVGVIMLSAFTVAGAEATMSALSLGAFDFVLKPSDGTVAENAETLRRRLSSQIRDCARARSIRNLRKKNNQPSPRAKQMPKETAARNAGGHRRSTGEIGIVTIGISTGGPPALATMLSQLPGDLPVPIAIVQHMPPLFTKSLAKSLDKDCALNVREAQDGDRLANGNVYIAPGGKQMRIAHSSDANIVQITDAPPENFCRPSVDYLFRSLVNIYGQRTLAVIMTGMGSDGTAGCRLLKQRDATIIAQDEPTCVVYGMPLKPTEEGLADIVAPLDQIAGHITRLVRREKLPCR